MTTMPSENELIEEANRDATVSPKRVSVLYGDYGKRKTTTACSMVNERGLLLTSDDSWKVLLNDRHKDIYSKIKTIPLQGISQLDYIKFDGYDTIIWDTVSQSIDVFLDILYDKGKWTNNQGRPAYREQVIVDKMDPVTLEYAELKGLEALAPIDYRVTRDRLRPAFNKLFRETDAHIIFTSQVTEPLPGLSKDQRNRPAIPGATFKVIGTRADIIAYITPDGNGKKFFANLDENSLAYLAKSRIEGLQGKMNLDDFVTKYKEIVFK